MLHERCCCTAIHQVLPKAESECSSKTVCSNGGSSGSKDSGSSRSSSSQSRRLPAAHLGTSQEVGLAVSAEEARSVGVAFSHGFDNAAYDRMAHDTQRVEQYSRAIDQAVPGHQVLDLGTGRDALLAQICAKAGAAHVVAVEVVHSAAEQARQAVKAAGLTERITVVEGHSANVPLPKVDTVVHEIVGGLALEEGMARALLDLQARPEVVDSGRRGWSLPRYVETRVAPVASAGLPTADIAGRQVVDIGEGQAVVDHWVQLPVDRLRRTPNPARATLLGPLRTMETLNAEASIKPQLLQERALRWRMTSTAVLAGFACGPWIDLDGRHAVDAWLGGTSWPHKLVGLASPVLVSPGDEVALQAMADLRGFPVRYGFRVSWRRPHSPLWERERGSRFVRAGV